jgi:hypothetical protein
MTAVTTETIDNTHRSIAFGKNRPGDMTEEGKLFLAEAQGLLKRADESIAKVRALVRGEFGEMQVGYVPPLNWPFILEKRDGMPWRAADVSTR